METNIDTINFENNNSLLDQNNNTYTPYYLYQSNIDYKYNSNPHKEDNFIKFVKFLKNDNELLVITDDNYIDLIRYDINPNKEGINNTDNNTNSAPGISTKQLFKVKENNHIYDYDMYKIL